MTEAEQYDDFLHRKVETARASSASGAVGPMRRWKPSSPHAVWRCVTGRMSGTARQANDG